MATVVLVGPYLCAKIALPRRAAGIARLWHRIALMAAGLTVKVEGAPTDGVRRFFVANHISYLDIPALGAVVDARFVAKAEVSGWPFFGFLARIAGTEFVDRNPRKAKGQADRLNGLLRVGESLLVFPEGTSSDGRSILAFKSSLFSAIEGVMDAEIQPIAIRYDADAYAWYGDMTLGPHLWQTFGRKKGLVRIAFLAPVDPSAFPDRKALAEHCRSRIVDVNRR